MSPWLLRFAIVLGLVAFVGHGVVGHHDAFGCHSPVYDYTKTCPLHSGSVHSVELPIWLPLIAPPMTEVWQPFLSPFTKAQPYSPEIPRAPPAC